jgi:hypothetical protein
VADPLTPAQLAGRVGVAVGKSSSMLDSFGSLGGPMQYRPLRVQVGGPKYFRSAATIFSTSPMMPSANSPSGSLMPIGLLLAYAYPLICCGSLKSIFGSMLRNRPKLSSYWRAPRLVRPVVGSWVPPTKPFSPGQVAGCGPRGVPYGVVRRQVIAPVAALMLHVAVPWWSVAWKWTPPAVRTATVRPPKA